MHSLSTHLRCAGDHGRLAFHPECPVCRRERLVGALPSEALVSRRAQALLASGVLALSGAPAAGAFAAEPDQEQQGSAAPDQVSGAPSETPAYDPGGGPSDLAFDDGAGLRSTAPGADSDGVRALDQETADDSAPILDAGDGDDESITGLQGTPDESAPPPPVSPEQPAAPGAPVTDTPEGEQTSPGHPPAKDGPGRTHKPRRQASAKPAKDEVIPLPVDLTQPSVAPRPSVALQPSPRIADGDRARPSDRFHVVLAGESLWSVAADRLEDDPPAARIAREVNRLWELNKERIATGDPDLLPVDTKLRLR